METCDERTIPGVDHAIYEIYRFMSVNATTISPSLGQNFSVPDYVYVTYTCEAGYHLQDPKNNVIGCEYVTTPRVGSKNVTAKAVWTSADGIICEEGEEQRKCKCWLGAIPVITKPVKITHLSTVINQFVPTSAGRWVYQQAAG